MWIFGFSRFRSVILVLIACTLISGFNFVNEMNKHETRNRNSNLSHFIHCVSSLHEANGIGDDIYIREKPPKLGKSSCRKFLCFLYISFTLVQIPIHKHFTSIKEYIYTCLIKLSFVFLIVKQWIITNTQSIKRERDRRKNGRDHVKLHASRKALWLFEFEFEFE